MKKIVFWLFVISAVGCNEPVDPEETVNNVADFIGEYQAIRIFECFIHPDVPYPCEPIVQDTILVIKEISESSFRILGFEAQIDQDGKISCCADMGYQTDIQIQVTIQNDTLTAWRTVRRFHSIVDTEMFIGVKGAKSPLKAGTVSFRSPASEVLESESGPAWIYLDLVEAKLGAKIVVEVLNGSAPVSLREYGDRPGSGIKLVNNRILLTVMPNTTSAFIPLFFYDDPVIHAARKIELRISEESVGITPSENRNYTLTILDDDVPSNNKIIFSQDFYVYDVNSDGSGLRGRTEFMGGRWPSFSPDGSRIVFVMETVGNDGDIYTMTFLGDDQKRLTNDNRRKYFASYSPAGDKILFVALVQESGDAQIFTINIDGTDETQISHIDNGTSPLEITSVSWSPDGTQILFTSNLGDEEYGYWNYIMNADGSNVRRLTDKSRNEGHPRFSPDGQKIIFNVGADNEESLYLMNADGTGEEKLFSGIAGLIARDAEWSPDGQTIIFQGKVDSPDFIIYASKIDGSNFGVLANQGMDHASWSPAK